MTEWTTLRARFPLDEFKEIERIKEEYDLSYNEIIRSGVKFYLGLTLAKELLASTVEGKNINIKGRDLSEILSSKNYQANLEQKATKLVKLLIFEIFDKGLEFKEKTKTIRKQRKVGRPKKEKKVGRPGQHE